MKVVSISEADIAQAVQRIKDKKHVEGDLEACAAWAVANFERYTRLSSQIRGLLWGADDKTLEEILDEARPGPCNFCGLPSGG